MGDGISDSSNHLRMRVADSRSRPSGTEIQVLTAILISDQAPISRRGDEREESEFLGPRKCSITQCRRAVKAPAHGIGHDISHAFTR